VKVGDLVNNTHALDRSTLGLIVEIQCEPDLVPDPDMSARFRRGTCEYRVQWINPPTGCPSDSWNSKSWLEVVNEQ